MSHTPPEAHPEDTESDDENTESEAAVDRPIERAAFLDDFPDAPQLQPLVAAFVAGNYARLRELDAALRKSEPDPEILELAHELVERTETDPAAKKILFLSIGFFLFILFWVYSSHGH